MTKGIGQDFMEKTQYRYLEVSDQSKGLPQPPLQLPHDESGTIIDLPVPAGLKEHKVDLRETIENRASLRRYSEVPLSLEDLSFLLWCTQGVKQSIDRPATMRTVPSAGARHAFETFLLVNNVEGVAPGLYRFLAIEHKLLEVNLDPNMADLITDACWRQRMVKKSAATFIWVAVRYRMAWRYGERGYRYLHLDAGHVCQNLYLAAEAVDSGVCAIAAFQDEEMNQLLDLDGVEQFVIYLATVGKKQG